LVPYFARANIRADAGTLAAFAAPIKERIKKLSDAVALADFLFVDEVQYDSSALIAKGMDAASARGALIAAQETLEKFPTLGDEDKVEAELRAASDKLGMKYAPFFHSLRVALTGKTASPPLAPSMRLLGKDKVLRRVSKAIELLA